MAEQDLPFGVLTKPTERSGRPGEKVTFVVSPSTILKEIRPSGSSVEADCPHAAKRTVTRAQPNRFRSNPVDVCRFFRKSRHIAHNVLAPRRDHAPGLWACPRRTRGKRAKREAFHWSNARLLAGQSPAKRPRRVGEGPRIVVGPARGFGRIEAKLGEAAARRAYDLKGSPRHEH